MWRYPSTQGCPGNARQLDAELKLVIAGNHDLDLDPQYGIEEGEEEECAEALALMTGPLAKQAGVTYLEEGTHSFTLPTGATFKKYVSPYSVEYGGYIFGTNVREDRFNNNNHNDAVQPIPNDVDIIMTHGPPYTIRDNSVQEGEVLQLGCPALLRATTRAKPKLHCFGHIHEGYGATKLLWNSIDAPRETPKMEETMKCNYIDATQQVDGQESLYVNAAIEGEGVAFSNSPFIVKLSLSTEVST